MKANAPRKWLTGVAIACTLAIVAACSGTSPSMNPTSPSALSSAGANFSPNPDEPPPPTCETDPTLPECPKPPDGKLCSPGYWKNHEDHFEDVCGSVPGWTCESLFAAITCKGSDASCRRNEAGDALSSVPPGCFESD